MTETINKKHIWAKTFTSVVGAMLVAMLVFSAIASSSGEAFKQSPVYTYLSYGISSVALFCALMILKFGFKAEIRPLFKIPDKKYFLARKGPKLYMTGVFESSVHSISTAKEQHLYLDTADAALMAGKRILIVDDVISTGESLSALEALVEKAGGNIVGRMAILAEGDAQNREDILYLEKLPLFHPDGTVME